jgi:iron complex transport system substrate-binding protein
MKRSIMSLIVLIALALVSVMPLAAQNTPEGFPLTIIDGAGRELTFDAPPQRVVTYYNDSYGMLATLGLMPVAQSVNPEMLTDPIYFAGQGGDIPTIPWSDAPDLEAVAAAQPDLVMVYSVEEADALEGIAPAFVTYDPATLDELYEAVQQYGLLFARQEIASVAVTAFQQRLAAYTSLAPRSVAVLKLGAMDAGAFYISTIDDPICQILNMLAICEWEKATPDEFWGYETSLEGVLELDPDVILLNNWSSASREEMLAALDANPLWNELRAVKTGRVIGTPGYENPIASSLPAATKFLDTYLPLIYPDIFPAPLTDEQVQEILAGEAAANTVTYPVTITDMTGRGLTFDAAPQRVICLFNRCAQELAFIGVAPVAVGAPYTYNVALDPLNFGELAETFGQIPQGENLDWEQVASYQPDLIIGDDTMIEQAAGIAPLYALSWDASVAATVENFTTDVRNYGRIFGIEAAVETRIQSALDRVAAYTELSPNNRSVLVVFFGDPEGSVIWIPSDCGLFISQMTICGNPGSPEWIEGSIETLLSFDPDVLIIEQYNVDDEAATLAALNADNALWNELTAVKNGNVHLVPVSRARTNTIHAVQGAVDALMPLIYPEVFPTALTDEQVQEIVNG